MNAINIIGIDASLRNVGMTAARYDLDTGHWTPFAIQLQETDNQKGKVVRQSSDDFRCGRENLAAVNTFIKKHGCTIAVSEVPGGAQSARAAFSNGMTCMLLAAVPLPMVEVSPREVKEASVGSRNASKEEMIRWANERWPELQWLRHGGRLVAKNEHLADACGVIAAGIETVQFAQAIAMMRSVALQRVA
jgi:Holliday junction resolvasome RuvABC endonuclease subunit